MKKKEDQNGHKTNVFEEPQGKEYVREPRRPRRLASKAVQGEERGFEEQQGNEYIREPNRSRSGTNPVPQKDYSLQEPRFEERQGNEYIREPDRSRRSVPQKEHKDRQGMEYV
ncbi:hypothetical protein ACET3Z_012032 [Daucus carota]